MSRKWASWMRNRSAFIGVMVIWLSIAGVAVQVLDVSPASAQLPNDFEDTLVASVSGGPTEIAWTPDGRMLIANKRGQVRIFQNGQLLSGNAINLEPIMCTNGERALGGIAVHPQFATNGYIYLYYTFNKYGTCNESEVNGPVNRLSRFTMTGNVIDPASELILMDTPPLFRDHHNAGDIQFGKDGMMYVTVGDGGTARFDWPQDPGRLLGKIVRLTDSGGIPADNPFTGSGTVRCNVDGVVPPGSPSGAKCQEIYALGLRNPWRFAFDPNASGVRFFVNDVGQHSWEEINESSSGANYGWPIREGACLKDSTTNCPPPPSNMTDPVYAYGHGPDGAAVTGGAFVPNGLWPSSWDGAYLFADYVYGEIYRLVPDPNNSFGYTHQLFTPASRVVSMRFGPDGALYYTSRENGVIRKITFTGASNRSPVAHISADPTSGAAPLEVQFDGSGSTDPDGDALSYAWDFQDDGTVDATGAITSHVYTEDGVFTARLTVDDGKGGVNSTTVRIDAGNEPPVPVIESPDPNNTYAVGDAFTLVGSAIDPEEGALPDTSLSWEVERHHADHTHPFLDLTPGNNIPFTYPEPEDFHAAGTSFLRVHLTATDSTGLSATVSQDLNPTFVDVTFLTEPPGLNVIVNESPITTPATEASWQNYELRLTAPDQVSGDGQGWVFDSWSTGGAQTHTVATPSEPTTFIATFKPGDVSSTHTFTPADDSQVRADEPDRNFGTSTSLRTDASPIINSYIKFDVNSLSGPISSAKLRIYPTSSNGVGFDVRGVANTTWQESSITYNNAPQMGGVIGSSGPTTADTWTEVDVTSLVTGNGLLSIGMTSSSSNAANFASKERDGGNLAPQLVVQIGTGADEAPPSTPTGVSAVAISSTQVDVSWQASTDNVGVTGYTIYRNNDEIGSVDGSTLSFSDTQAVPSTSYTYAVAAFDAAGNRSSLSDSVPVVTPGAGGSGSQTFVTVADAQVREDDPTRNYGTSNSLRTDAEPIIRSYIKFNLSGIDGNVTKATIRIYATSANTVGYRIFKTNDSSWTETGINYSNAPAIAGDPIGSSGRVFAETWTEVDVSGAVTGNGTLTLIMDSTSKTAANFASKEMTGGNLAPHLVVEFGEGGGEEDTTPPSVPAGLAGTAISQSQIDLSWEASSDNVGVTGYTIYRNGTELVTVDGATVSHSDTSLAASTSYSYTVDAFDAAGNRSAQSDPVVVETPGEGDPVTLNFVTIADSQVREDDPARNFGNSGSIRTDAEPIINSYLKFDVSGTGAGVTKATLFIHSTSSNTVGYRIHGVANTSWQESTINYNNAPAIDASHVGASGATTAGSWTQVDITALVQGDGLLSLGMTSTSKTAANYASKEHAGGSFAPYIEVEVGGGSGEDKSPPSVPAGLTATAINTTQIDLAWQSSTDNVGVTGYTIYRDGAEIASVDSATLAYSDTGVQPSTSYSYEVDAIDAAGNRSGRSDSATAATPGEGGGPVTVTFNPIADAQVREDEPGRNFGNSVSLRTDAIPIINSYLKFDVSDLNGNVTSAKLRIYATSANSVGYQIRGVADTSWTESGINYGNAPAIGADVIGASGRVFAGEWTEVDVTSYIQGNGLISLAMTSTNATATNFGSRESGGTAPQLIIETSP